MRKWFEPVSTAWLGIVTHKLRSFLTILGVVIGVGAVIALMSIGKGAEHSIISNIQSLGADLMFIRPGATTESGVRTAVGSARTLTLEDANAIAAEVPDVVAVAPSLGTALQVVYSGQNMRAQVQGVTPDYLYVYNLEIASGRFFTEYDYQSSARIAVVGANVATTLFPDSDAVGQPVRAGNYIIRIVGVLASKGTSITGQTDDAILMPLSTMQIMTGQQKTARGERIVGSIGIKVTNQNLSPEVKEAVSELLRFRHQLGPGVDNDFTITSLEEIISSVSGVINQMTFLLGAIAAISLVVGGIGVMNIMLVSVVERTREIGIRKALGAKEWDIWGQFLTEAAMLTFTGGIFGVAGGWVVSYFVNRSGLVPALVTADIVALAVSVAIGIGLFFGFYPAWQASRLNPIEALRAE
ncbi:MAG: ABC transporter permease [Dehalococcoidia bacterium]|nr:ABC transporter permease [Dehalococcoidia bacterium]